DPQGCEAGRSPRGAAHEVRVRRQLQDREGVRPDAPSVPAAAGGRGDRVSRGRPTDQTRIRGSNASRSPSPRSLTRQSTNIRTTNGYAKNGSGRDVGSGGYPRALAIIR